MGVLGSPRYERRVGRLAFAPRLGLRERATAASGRCLRLSPDRGVKLAGVLLAGDGGSVPASLATAAPARPGWPGAGWLTVSGGWFAPPAEILAFG
jgi:hypothetical protein